jgi:hypothetical protein
MSTRITQVFNQFNLLLTNFFRLAETLLKHSATLHHLVVEFVLLSLLIRGAFELLAFLHLKPGP